MASTDARNTLSDVFVRQAMRSQIVFVQSGNCIAHAIRHIIKYKVNALLVADEDEMPLGVVSKTDIIGAYYAGLPINTSIDHIMVSPPLYCHAEDSLESALDLMKSMGVYRLFVPDPDTGRAAGVLAYPDIVGILYQYCRSCDRSLIRRREVLDIADDIPRFLVLDAMTPCVVSFGEDRPVAEVLEGLCAYRFGAVLIRDGTGLPKSVVSKTDLVRAYARNIPLDAQVRVILAASRVYSCSEKDHLEDAIRQMVLTDVHRLFVHGTDVSEMIGVFSLSNAARIRSGSCHACVSSRIRVEDA
ncbi:MAG: CBS domain-containing protein [Desulfomonilaceae bacterium]|nr:CBS domain-containing protein [Desulfomonilaceae bacterium]